MKFLVIILVSMTSVGLTSMGAGLETLFQDRTLAVVIQEKGMARPHVYNADRAAQRFTAYSTFKIPHMVVALESGLVPGADHVIAYDAAKYPGLIGKGPGGSWGRDHDLNSAFRNSVVWYFQELAGKADPGLYGPYLKRFDYGNQDQSGGATRFWLTSLKISALEQVHFLERLHANDFKLKPSTVKSLRESMLLKETSAYRLYGKTGTGQGANGQWQGWLVGFLETDARVYYYAILVEGESYREVRDQRKSVLGKTFRHLGISMK